MLDSTRTLVTAQRARLRSLPAKLAERPGATSSLELFRQRNATLDALFYDVGKVSDDEAQLIGPWLAREGALLIVPPSGGGSLTLCPTLDDFAGAGGTAVRALAVAGVGSSALGAAAFARNVADATGAPVAAVVSGYGLSDLMAEALGGWLWFGTLNQVRHAFEVWDKLRARSGEQEKALSGETRGLASLDTRTVLSLLSDDRFEFSLLTGHSKGNLVISEALYALAARGVLTARDLLLVTVSAAIAMPPAVRDIVDVMGELDWFGGMNSRPDIGVERRVPLAWHHTNTDLPFHLPVTSVMRAILAERT